MIRMTRNNPSQMVRSVPGDKPTEAQASAGRAEARANKGPTQEQIRLRAFQIFESRGAIPGHDAEDWMQAERELKRID